MSKRRAGWCLVLAVIAVSSVSCGADDDDETGGTGGRAGGASAGAAGADRSSLAGSDEGGTNSLAGAATAGGAGGDAAGGVSGSFGTADCGGESGNAGVRGNLGHAGAGGEPSGAHCVLKVDAPCTSTDTDCTTGYRCVSGDCVAGPIAGEPAVGPSQTDCAHGFYASAATQHLCVARAPLGTLNCGGVPGAEGPLCVEEYPCIFHTIALELRCSERLPEGSLCGTNTDCAPGLDCTNGGSTIATPRCRAPLPTGAVCNFGAGDCETGSHCVPADPTFSHCVAYPGLSVACESGHCGKGLVCHDNTCVPPAMLNEPCDTLACAEGLVCVGLP
jgi:hypothetical protein